MERDHIQEGVEAHRPPVELKMLYVDHIEDNVESILPELVDADIIAIEYVTPTPEDRQESEYGANYLMHNKAEYIGKLSPGFTENIIEAERGSGKKIVFLDMNESDPAYSDAERSVNDEIEWRTRYPAHDLEDYLADIDRQARLQAYWNSTREQTVADQLKSLVKAQSKPTKIVAIVGATHTPISRGLQQDKDVNLQVSREFYTDHPVDLKTQFIPNLELQRHYSFHPDQPASRRLLLKVAAKPALDLQQLMIRDIGEVKKIVRDREQLDRLTDEQLEGLAKDEVRHRLKRAHQSTSETKDVSSERVDALGAPAEGVDVARQKMVEEARGIIDKAPEAAKSRGSDKQ